MRNLLGNKKGFFYGLLAMAIVFIMIMGMNMTTLYSHLFTFCSLTEMQLPVSQEYYYASAGIERGIWLIKNHLQPPEPLSAGSEYNEYNFSVNGIDGVKTVSLTITCMVAASGYDDSCFRIVSTSGNKTLEMHYELGRRMMMTY